MDENNEDNEIKNEIKENPLPADFVPVPEEEYKKDDSIFEVYKSDNYKKIFPSLIQKINQKIYHNKPSEDYPYFTESNKVKFLPKLSSPSEILTNNQLKELHIYFPYFLQYSSLSKVFSLTQNGADIKTLFKNCEGIKNTILVIKDKEGNIFGAFLSDVLYPSATFTGTPDTFLFTFYKEEKIHVYKATQINDNYMYCDYEQICFGNSGKDFSLSVKCNLLDGYSKTTDTYKNKALNGGENFHIVNLEIWGFKGD